MYHNTSSRCDQTSAPVSQNATKSVSGSVKLPRTHAEWSKALSPIPESWVLTPVKDKRPLRPNWQDEDPIERSQLLDLLVNGQKLQGKKGKEWHCQWSGVGIRLGVVSGGLMAIDADGDNGEARLQEFCGGELPETVCWTSGKEGRRQLLYKIPPEHWAKMRTIKLDCGEEQYLEFRWDGCQSVLPPSRHPETGQYRWLVSPEESEVAIAPVWLIDYFISGRKEEGELDLFTSIPATGTAELRKFTHRESRQPLSDIERAIIFLNALATWRADNYDEWLKVGMALHSISESLLYLWEEWSRQSSKYQPGVCEKKWKSFSPQKGIGIGSLCQWAKEDGWQSQKRSLNGNKAHRIAPPLSPRANGAEKMLNRISETPSSGAGKWILGVEGEERVEVARGLGVVAITCPVESAAESEIIEGLLKIKDTGVSALVYWPDHDRAGYKKAESLVNAGRSIDLPVVILDPLEIWPDIPDKGDIADWVTWGKSQNMTDDDFISRLETAIHSAVAKRDDLPGGSEGEDQKKSPPAKPPKPDVIAADIAGKYIDKWLYCDEIKSWMEYEYSTPGVWHPVTELYVSAQIHHILKANFISGYGESYLNSIVGVLKRELFIAKWESDPDLLPFTDRILELDTGKTRDHHPGNRLTWVLPRPYISPRISWASVDNWLTEATGGNEAHKKTLLCFAAAVLRRRYDLQKFLHLIGSGGSGKTTFMNLLVSLVGENNTASIDLENLDERDALAELFGKVLVVFPDQDSAGRKISNFKKLTGGDLLRGRLLYRDGFNFRYSGMSLITSNNPIFHGATAKWLTRRALMIPFNLSVPASRARNLDREFQPELSALTNYLLSIPVEEIEAVLSGKTGVTSTLWAAQVRSDGLASWLNDSVILDPMGQARIGADANEWRDGGYNPQLSTLFGSYCLHCRQSNRSPLTKDNFSANLLELLQTLNWNVEKVRTNTGRFIMGIRLRTPNDDEILPLDEMLVSNALLEVNNQSVGTGDDLGDDLSDDLSDDLKHLPELTRVGCDDLTSKLTLTEIVEPHWAPTPLDDPWLEDKTWLEEQESISEIDRKDNNIGATYADTPTQTETGREIEVVTEVVTEVITEVVTDEYGSVISIPENPRILIELSTDLPLIFLRQVSQGFYLVLDDHGVVRKVGKIECCDITDIEEIPQQGDIVDETSSSYLIRTPDGKEQWVNKKRWDKRCS